MESCMHMQLETRMGELQAELAKGRTHLAELQAEQSRVLEACLRIEGACSVLQELLAQTPKEDTVLPCLSQ